MRESLEEFETTLIDQLDALRERRETLTERLEKLAEMDGVSAPVAQRIRDDYTTDLAEIAGEAEPLEREARTVRSRLRAVAAEIQAELETVELDLEEVEVRRTLGELLPEQVEKRVQELGQTREERARELALAESHLEGFVRVLGDDEEEADDLRPTEATEPEATIDSAEPEDSTEPEEAAESKDEPESGSDPEVKEATVIEELPPPPSVEATGQAESTAEAAPADSPAEAEAELEIPPPPPAVPTAVSGSTRLLNLGVLVAQEPIDGRTEFRLDPLTTIGRTDENQIALGSSAVSRRHAELSLTPTGYLLKDLDSENGTFVNGERIRERALVDGDRILIATVSLLFRDAEGR